MRTIAAWVDIPDARQWGIIMRFDSANFVMVDGKSTYAIVGADTCKMNKPARVPDHAPILRNDHKSTPDETRLTDRKIIIDARPDDLLVCRKRTDGTRALLGVVRKADGRVMYRVRTPDGLGAWHVVRGCTRRMPQDVMTGVFGPGAYTVDAGHARKTFGRENRCAIARAAPHDRMPQRPILGAPRKNG